MAKKIQHVWGIEIGQSSLKALRCHAEGDQVVADTFDYVEYPKILSQPEAEPEALVADALSQFLSRNDLKGATKIGVSVPGQSGLAKFFKPPPVEVKKIGDIVRYEAKQQIPFDLNDVIWDFQQMEGAQIEDGYALESEVGLFAMKKDAVFRALKPYRDQGIDIDLVQLAPMSLYNLISHERFAERMANEEYDPDSPQKNTVLLSIGTDASDLIVTNGFRIWQRSVPIGGNHFTRQLTKDLKLTFAKAEHLKKNAMQADDPKLVFQAMRPVFNDMVTEIQRSLAFFKSLN
jgi:type IV pilus assembly protein PilM